MDNQQEKLTYFLNKKMMRNQHIKNSSRNKMTISWDIVTTTDLIINREFKTYS
jgi:hypothetical protein